MRYFGFSCPVIQRGFSPSGDGKSMILGKLAI